MPGVYRIKEVEISTAKESQRGSEGPEAHTQLCQGMEIARTNNAPWP